VVVAVDDIQLSFLSSRNGTVCGTRDMACPSRALSTRGNLQFDALWQRCSLRNTTTHSATKPCLNFFAKLSNLYEFALDARASGPILMACALFFILSGGACGYGTLVDVVPMKARVGSVSPVLFKDGEGCGACYKVKCLDHGICSRRAVTVIVTDECPGGLCAFGRTHFDLSGAAFSRMAVAGAGGRLRDRGELSVVYRR
jgi:hypothetical protein